MQPVQEVLDLGARLLQWFSLLARQQLGKGLPVSFDQFGSFGQQIGALLGGSMRPFITSRSRRVYRATSVFVVPLRNCIDQLAIGRIADLVGLAAKALNRFSPYEHLCHLISSPKRVSSPESGVLGQNPFVPTPGSRLFALELAWPLLRISLEPLLGILALE